MKKGLKITIIILAAVVVIAMICGIVGYQKKSESNQQLNELVAKENTDKEVYLDKTNTTHFSKTIKGMLIELDIPNEWNYEEKDIDDEGECVRFYKSNKDQYAALNFYNSSLGVCGTGRRTETTTLNNGEEVTIGYDEIDGKGGKDWSDVSFHNINKIAFINYGLEDQEAKEMIEVIKTIKITQ